MITSALKRLFALLATTAVVAGLLSATMVPASAAYAQNPPTNFRVSAIAATTVDLSWNANPSPANYYRVKYATNSSFSNPTYQTVQNATSMRIMGLKPGTRYYFQVRAIQLRSGKETGLSDYTKPGINRVTNTNYFNPPASLRVDDVYSNKLDISWGVVPNAHSYEIAVSGKANQNYVDMSTMQRVSTSIEGLSPNTSYTIRVRALQQQGQVLTDWRSITGRTSAVEPGVDVTTPPPGGLAAPDVASGLIGLTWNPVEGATGYRVQWWAGGANPAESAVRYHSVPASQVGTSPSLTFDGTIPADTGAAGRITARTTYSFRIAALRDGTETRISNYSGTRSNPLSVTTTNFPEVAPKDVTIADSSIEKTSAAVSWSAVTGATNYRVAWSTSSSRPSRCEPNCVVTATDRTQHTITGLAPGTRYYVWVSAIADGTTISDFQPAPQQFRTVPAVELPERIWQDQLNSETAIRARWSPVAGATAYEYRWSRRSDMGSATAAVSVGTATAVTVSNLVQDQIHFFQVRVRSGSQTSGWSDAVALKTPVNYGAARGVVNGPHRGSATVIAYNSAGAQVSSSTVDAATGEFLVQDLRPGPHTFQVVHSDNVSSTSPWVSSTGGSGVPYRVQANQFTVPGWSNTAATPLVLPTMAPAEGRTITGTLSSDSARCLSDLRVVVKSNSTTSTGEVLADESLPGSGGTQRTFVVRGIPKSIPARVWVFGTCADASAALASSTTDQSVGVTVFDPKDLVIPSAIGGLATSNITAHDATLSWNTVPTAVDYRVYVRTTNSFPATCEPNCWIVVPAVSAGKASVQLSSLVTPKPGQRYYFKVSARNSAGKAITGWQGSAHAFTLGAGAQIPSTVQNISTTNITASNATISWDIVPTATKYRLYIRTSNSFPGTCEPNCWVVTPTVSGNRASVNLDTLVPAPKAGTRYYVKISAINASNKTITGWQSTAHSFVLGGSAPSIPDVVQGIAATDISATNAKLSWDAVPTAATYRVYIRTTDTFPNTCEPDCWVVSPPVVDGKVSVNLNALLTPRAGQTYYVKVSASNAAGKLLTKWQPSAYSFRIGGADTGTPDPAPTDPAPTDPAPDPEPQDPTGPIPKTVEGIAASQLTASNATLSWNAVPTAQKYRVYIRTTNSFPSTCEPHCWVVEDFRSSAGKVSINLDSVLAPRTGVAYYVKVSAINDAGKTITGWQSSATSFRLAVDGIEATDITATNATLSWNAVPNAARYRVYVRTTDTFPTTCEPDCWLVTPSVSGTRASIDLSSVLTPRAGQTYHVKISAVTSTGRLVTGWQDTSRSFTMAS